MNAVLFPGQGCQSAGMGASLVEADASLRALYDLGSEVLGYDLYRICMEGTAEELAQTGYAQPAIYVTSLVCLEAAKKQGLTYEAAAGHSLGEYAAMTACGMLTPEEGFRALKIRAKAMDDAAKQSDSGMYAILHLPVEEITRICEETEGYVIPVNYNAPEQTVIAGDTAAVEAAAEACKAAGARVAKLAVSAAFHSERMTAAADIIRAEFKSIQFQAPTAALYANLTGDKLEGSVNMADYCADHCIRPVRFTDQLAAMQRGGVTKFIELGPKKVLTKLVTQTLSDVEAIGITDAKSLAAAFSAE